MGPDLNERERACWVGFVLCVMLCVLILCVWCLSEVKAAEVPCTFKTMDANPLYLESVPVMWKKSVCGTETMGCYTLDQVKQLKLFDMDLTLKLEEFSSCRQSLMDMQTVHEDQVSLLKLAVEREDQWRKLAEARASDYMAALDDLETCEARPDIWSYLPWFVTGAVVVGGVFFGVGWYLGSR